MYNLELQSYEHFYFCFLHKHTQDATEIKRDTKRMFLLDENWKLQIRRADISDTARYSCKATNIAGTAEKYFDLNVLGKLNSYESECNFVHILKVDISDTEIGFKSTLHFLICRVALQFPR